VVDRDQPRNLKLPASWQGVKLRCQAVHHPASTCHTLGPDYCLACSVRQTGESYRCRRLSWKFEQLQVSVASERPRHSRVQYTPGFRGAQFPRIYISEILSVSDYWDSRAHLPRGGFGNVAKSRASRPQASLKAWWFYSSHPSTGTSPVDLHPSPDLHLILALLSLFLCSSLALVLQTMHRVFWH
jgi:hypothetical protein